MSAYHWSADWCQFVPSSSSKRLTSPSRVWSAKRTAHDRSSRANMSRARSGVLGQVALAVVLHRLLQSSRLYLIASGLAVGRVFTSIKGGISPMDQPTTTKKLTEGLAHPAAGRADAAE